MFFLKDIVRDRLTLLLNGRAIVIDAWVYSSLCDIIIKSFNHLNIMKVGIRIGGKSHRQNVHMHKEVS